MSKTLTLRLDDATYNLFAEAAKAESRPLESFVESAVTAQIRERRSVAANGSSSTLQKAVEEAERGVLEGKWVEHDQVVAKLKRWAAGGS